MNRLSFKTVFLAFNKVNKLRNEKERIVIDPFLSLLFFFKFLFEHFHEIAHF